MDWKVDMAQKTERSPVTNYWSQWRKETSCALIWKFKVGMNKSTETDQARGVGANHIILQLVGGGCCYWREGGVAEALGSLGGSQLLYSKLQQ